MDVQINPFENDQKLFGPTVVFVSMISAPIVCMAFNFLISHTADSLFKIIQ